jgi:hypothetical protein
MRQTGFQQFFLVKAYKQKRFVFWMACLFLVCQLSVSFTRGVFTPFYNFGMYSAVYKIKPAYPVLEIYSKGALINYNNYTLHQWNRILISYDYCVNPSFNDSFFQERIEPIMGMAGLQPNRSYYVMDRSAFAQQKRLEAWKQLSEKILETKIDSFRIRNYTWNGSQLTAQ